VVDLFLFHLDETAVAIWLKDRNKSPGVDYRSPATNAPPGVFILDGLSVFGSNYAAQVRTDGTLWSGEVRNINTAYGGYPRTEEVPMFDNTGPGGLGRVRSIHRNYSAPPRGGTWLKNCHVLEMELPASGQFGTLRCASSGTYNTASPPVWYGSDPVSQDEDDTMPGGYLADNTYWTPIEL
jgi:hypothetical protein